MERSMKHKVMGGLAWAFAERMSAQLISLLVTIVLARLLIPEHYGLISIVLVCINLLDVFVTSSFGSALVQKKEADALDFDTAFVLSFSLSCVLYVALFAVSPYIAAFYEMPELCAVLRVMGIRVLLAAINNIQQANIQRRMNFKKFFWINSLCAIMSGAVGITMAVYGYGVWSLVAQYLFSMLASTIIMFIVGEWKPSFQFSVEKAKSIWGFGWKVLLTQLVATLEGDIRSLLVGKVFGSADLAYYDQGRKYPALLVTNVSTTIDKVMLPAYSREQENRMHILSMLRRSVSVGIYVLAPLLLGFAMVADSFVKLILTEKWIASIPFVQVFCLAYLVRPLESSCRQALLSIGKSDKVFWAMFIINATALLGVVISVFWFKSVFLIAVSSIVTTIVSLGCFLAFSRKYFHYTVKMQLQDCMPSLVVSAIMAAVVYCIGLLKLNLIFLLTLQILVGAVVYLVGSVLFKLEPFIYLLDTLKGICKR